MLKILGLKVDLRFFQKQVPAISISLKPSRIGQSADLRSVISSHYDSQSHIMHM